MRSAVLLLALLAGCHEIGEGTMVGAVSGVDVAQVTLAWLPASFDEDPMVELGASAPSSANGFDPALLLGGETEPALDCDDEGARFGVALLVGPGGEAGSALPLADLEESQSALCDDVVAVAATEDIGYSGDLEDIPFETELSTGVHLMRKVPCRVALETCFPLAPPRFCLEPLAEDALVLLRPW